VVLDVNRDYRSLYARGSVAEPNRNREKPWNIGPLADAQGYFGSGVLPEL
jgi:hypothetical protein